MDAPVRRLYFILLAASTAGLLWLLYSMVVPQQTLDACIIKSVTGIPCPSCGTTRAVSALVKGDFVGSLLLNPFGLIVLSAFLIVPLWIVYDFVFRKVSFFEFYTRTERILKKRYVGIPLAILVFFNWIWNIYKGT